LGNLYNSAFEIKIVYFSQYNLDVATAGEDPADGRCDFAGRQSGGCDLIEQRLEGVVVSAVDYRNPDGMAGELQRRIEAAEASADNHDMRNRFTVHLRPSSKPITF
jgi:hypothetical protein